MSQLRTLERIADILIRMNDETLLGSQLSTPTLTVDNAKRELARITTDLKSFLNRMPLVAGISQLFNPINIADLRSRLNVVRIHAQGMIDADKDALRNWANILTDANYIQIPSHL